MNTTADVIYRITITYIAKDKVEHTIQSRFSSLPLGLTKTKSICLKDDVQKVKRILIEEV